MGGNNNQSGNDPRGRVQNQSAHQQERYENQQGPMVNAFAQNYGRASESDYGNYTDIMNQYRNIASGAGSTAGSGGGGGGGGGGYTAFTVTPGKVTPGKAVAGADPFNSYAGYQEFSKTGGYSPEDIANMRARGTSPIRAAYANAQREVARGRTLQGGYSPNAAAAQVKMAREQSQANADAMQNVEAGLAEARNKGRLAGLGGMQGIEGQRYEGDIGLSKFNTDLDFRGQTFNTDLDFRGQTYNADAQARAQAGNNANANAAADRGAYSAAATRGDQLRALSGMTNLYGTTPGASQLFGNQLLQGVGQGGTFGLGLMGRDVESQQLPGAWDQGMGRIGDVMDAYGAGSTAVYPWLDDERNKRQQPAPYSDPYENQPGGSDYDY